MGAPRKYTREQRAAIGDAYEQGCEPTEIAQMCSAGIASLPPFEIPVRTVHEIAKREAAERGGRFPREREARQNGNGANGELGRIRLLALNELARLERKTSLTPEDVAKLDTLERLIARTEAPVPQQRPARKPPGQEERPKESILEKLAIKQAQDEAEREQAARAQENGQTAEQKVREALREELEACERAAKQAGEG